MHVIPQSWSHLHILISVFPTFGLVIVLGYYLAALRRGDDFARQTCLVLFSLLGLLSIPSYISGMRSAADLSGNARFSPDSISTHYVWAIATLGVLALVGLAAAVELWRAWPARRAFSLSAPTLAHATAGSGYTEDTENGDLNTNPRTLATAAMTASA